MEEKIIGYMRGKWPSLVKEEWRVQAAEYAGLAEKILVDFTAGATQGREMWRITGQSGSGKTTQLLPAVLARFEKMGRVPVMVAARRFVEYHPYHKEIEQEYGAENLREKTNEVSTILMFLSLRELIARGYDIILDVALLDPLVEGVLTEMLRAKEYSLSMTMVAVSREISDEFILKRKGRVVAKSTADEFWRVNELALRFYAEKMPEARIVVWSVWDVLPIFDGEIGDAKCLQAIERYWAINELPDGILSEEELRQRKITYLGGE